MTRLAAVIGDIHGEAELLALLLETVRERYGPDVDFYNVGDLVDRGPDSKGVIQLCIDNNIQGVLGNHETWLHQYLSTWTFDTFALHPVMGGVATLKSYGVTSKDPDEIERQLRHQVPAAHRAYLLGLPLWRKISLPGPTYRVTHTGIKISDATNHLGLAERSGRPVYDALCDMVAKSPSFLWSGANLREPNLYRFSDGSRQIFGHTPVRTPIRNQGWIAVDTGSGTKPPFSLTAVILPMEEFVTVSRFSGGITEFSL